MKALITGMNGTVGTALANYLRQHDWEVIGWDRRRVPIDRYQPMEDFVRAEAPDVVFHLAIASQASGQPNESWLVNYDWPSELAWITRILNIKLIFTSSVMVFSNSASGPFTIHSTPDAADGYGYEKRRAEERVFYQNPDARIVRLGWQIGEAPGTNNMIDFFAKSMQDKGYVDASTKWYPACSFLPDTVELLTQIIKFPPGLYQVNANDRWTFFEIACALNDLHGGLWDIRPTENFVYDQRMIDGRVAIGSLKKRLPNLS